MLAKPSTQLTVHTHPSAGVFGLLKFVLSHEEEEEEEKGSGILGYRVCQFASSAKLSSNGIIFFNCLDLVGPPLAS